MSPNTTRRSEALDRHPRAERRSRGNCGFTLVELLVVLAIISLAAGTALHASNNMTRAQSAATFSRGLLFQMQRARSAALADDTQRRLACSPSGCKIQRASIAGMRPTNPTWADTGDEQSTAPTSVLWAVNPTADLGSATATGPLATTAYITFYPNGSASAATVYVTDRRGASHFKVYVFAATGAARMVDRW